MGNKNTFCSHNDFSNEEIKIIINGDVERNFYIVKKTTSLKVFLKKMFENMYLLCPISKSLVDINRNDFTIYCNDKLLNDELIITNEDTIVITILSKMKFIDYIFQYKSHADKFNEITKNIVLMNKENLDKHMLNLNVDKTMQNIMYEKYDIMKKYFSIMDLNNNNIIKFNKIDNDYRYYNSIVNSNRHFYEGYCMSKYDKYDSNNLDKDLLSCFIEYEICFLYLIRLNNEIQKNKETLILIKNKIKILEEQSDYYETTSCENLYIKNREKSYLWKSEGGFWQIIIK